MCDAIVLLMVLAHLLDGFGIELDITLVPTYISKITRGQLNTLPQFSRPFEMVNNALQNNWKII